MGDVFLPSKGLALVLAQQPVHELAKLDPAVTIWVKLTEQCFNTPWVSRDIGGENGLLEAIKRDTIS